MKTRHIKLWSSKAEIRKITAILLGLLLSCHTVSAQYLLRVSPGGEGGSRPAYVYGGKLAHYESGPHSNLYDITYDEIDTVSANNYKPQRISKDPTSDNFLVEYISKSDGKLLVATGSLCPSDNSDLKLKTQIANILIDDTQNKYFLDSNCGEKCGWGSFTLFNGEIYFLLSAVLGTSPSNLIREIQIRKLSGCEDLLKVAASGVGTIQIQILQCSTFIDSVYR